MVRAPPRASPFLRLSPSFPLHSRLSPSVCVSPRVILSPRIFLSLSEALRVSHPSWVFVSPTTDLLPVLFSFCLLQILLLNPHPVFSLLQLFPLYSEPACSGFHEHQGWTEKDVDALLLPSPWSSNLTSLAALLSSQSPSLSDFHRRSAGPATRLP